MTLINWCLKIPIRFIVLAILLLLVACSGEAPPQNKQPQQSRPATAASKEKESASSTPSLRVIVRPEPVSFLPRNAEPVRIDRELARGVADYLGLDYQPVVVRNYSDMIDQLLAGKADMIAASLTITKSRAKKVLFSIPYLHVDELLIVPEGKDAAAAWQDLNGKTICVRDDSSYLETLQELQGDGISLSIKHMSAWLNTEEIVDMVNDGSCPATVVDSHYWSAIKKFYDGVQSLRPLAEARPIALAVAPDRPDLKQKIDHYLTERALIGQRDYNYSDDLPGLKKRGQLRMITRNSAESYYLYRGSPYGFEYELLNKFAQEHNLHLEIVIPPDNESLLPWLNEGRGDVAAAMLTVIPERTAVAAMTRPYFYSDEVVAVRNDDTGVTNINDLAGRRIYVRKSSSYYQTCLKLQQQVNGINIELVPEATQTSEILENIDKGKWDLTIVNHELLQIEQTYGRNLRAAFSVSKASKIGWAVRKQNPKLLRALNKFIKSEYRGLFYNLRKARYFENKKMIARADSKWRLDQSGIISPYDKLVKKYAIKQSLDWRLLVSQMYQESRFNPKMKSWAGARGLMQLLPRAAREVGVRKLDTPDQQIKAGVRYLRRMIDLFDPRLPLATRIRFGLASYNAGRGHVLDARRLARQKGWSANAWYGNVERAMLLLSKPGYFQKARFGFVRGEEPVEYVRDIETRYAAYVQQLP